MLHLSIFYNQRCMCTHTTVSVSKIIRRSDNRLNPGDNMGSSTERCLNSHKCHCLDQNQSHQNGGSTEDSMF